MEEPTPIQETQYDKQKEEGIKNKIIEMWDEDQGWIRWCENCGRKVDENMVGYCCPHCYQELKELERV